MIFSENISFRGQIIHFFQCFIFIINIHFSFNQYITLFDFITIADCNCPPPYHQIGNNRIFICHQICRQISLTFTVPYSRIRLADYLNCDRSALSRELSLMQRDGLLETYKSSFKLLEPDALRHMVL